MSASLAYRPDIDGLRALAVLLVIGYHAFPSRVPGGFVGVDVFFVISGFLITRIIVDDADAGRFTFTDFYVRRCRRIFPALAVVLLGTWLIGFATLTGFEFKSLGRHIAAGSAFGSNLLLWSEAGYFDGPSAYKPLLHLWSLGVEEQYYLLWPLMLLVLLKRRSIAPIAIGLILAASLALDIVVTRSAVSTAFYMLPTRFWELLTGATLAFGNVTGRRSVPWATLLSAMGLVAIVAATFLIDPAAPYPGWRAIAPVVGAALLIAAGPASRLNATLFSLRAVVLVGLISYPLYLWHWPLLSIFGIVSSQLNPSPSVVKLVKAVLICASFALAYATYRLVERPTQARVKRFCVDLRDKRRAIAALAGVLAAIGVVGVTTAAADGFVFRHRVRDMARYRQHDEEISLQAFDDYLAQFPPCGGLYAPLARALWCYQATAERPDIALIGDSHARSLFPGFAEAVEQRGAGHVLLASRCVTLLGVRVHDQPECVDDNTAVVDRIAGDAAIHDVILSSRGPLYVSGTGYGPAELGIGKTLQAPDGGAGGQTSMGSLFLRGSIETIRRLEDAGKRVTFVVDVPELGFVPGDCLYARPYQGPRAALRAPCAVPAADVRARQAEYRDVLRDLSAARPQMRLFDPARLLCDDAYCYAERGERLLYTDSNHLGVYGSRLIGGALAGVLSDSVSAGPSGARQ